ncbi:MAG: signal peptide peptidase SppA [Deltaproteobacteria bacterium]|nr:signal peptide peptidase SppA [Deltaproteobacteria bacterium]
MKLGKKQKNGFLKCYLVAVLFTLAASGCAFVNVSLYQPALPLQEQVLEGEGPGKVLVMDISGVLAYEENKKESSFREEVNLVTRVKEELNKASIDSEVKALILRIQSPGGTVNASDLIHHEILEFKKRRNVTVVACFLGMATSGGYYIATAADHIVAQPTTLTGSIGTIALKFNVEGLMEKVGVDEETVKSGDKKDMWSPFRPASAEEKKILQSIIDEYQGKFLEVVRAGRKNMTEADLAMVTDGRIFSGTQALKLRLVDQLGYLNDAVQWAKNAVGMEKAKVVMYHRPGTYVDNIYSMSPGEAWSWAERLQKGELLPQKQTPQFMYIWIP